VAGTVEVVVDAGGDERLVATHGAGRFLGELNLSDESGTRRGSQVGLAGFAGEARRQARD